MWVDISVCWFVDFVFHAGDGNDDVNKFGFGDGYGLVYSDGFFDSFSVDKYSVRYLYESHK